MSNLRSAAQQALEALEYCEAWDHDMEQQKTQAITALRAALVEDAMQKFTDVNQELQAALGCDHCNSPLYAAIKCRVCGRVTKPVQEPVAMLWQHRETGRTRVLMPNERTATDVAAAFDVVGPLYLAPPQRKPLTKGEISNIWDGHVVTVFGKNGINPIVFARAIERAHNITGDNT